ncbi:GMC family oxidoreductase [Bradyrhizobium sp. BR 10261]|uniref:GMC family oxidoreductase n=1 Tax=Bradyrhizobium sp. BR 10261 TaxID=2749992 RepID=UPI001C64E4D3|nr:GMC family oxidoreductase [Bradyrhizobium sp. BR 10261]MBW7963320.1 GMC family oxidoreductase [Bradyrhizobium sp. BR 10261]
MATRISQPEYDVIIVGSGVSGALIANQLARKQLRVLILEAGGVARESIGRYELLSAYAASTSKATDSPYCGDNILATQPDPRNTNAPDTSNYLYYPPQYSGDMFKSFYERIVGGTTWHWQAIYVRMLPTDFKLNSTYHVKQAVDWPIGYSDIEPYYVRAEEEMGVSGSMDDFRRPRFHNPMSKPYPMPPLAQSYVDQQFKEVIDDEYMDARLEGAPMPMKREMISLRPTPVPHAINSQPYDGRPVCDGRTSCVPLCPIKARYEAVFHVEKALRAGATLRKQAVVRNLDFDGEGKRVVGVHYLNWVWQEDSTKPEENGRRAVLSEGYATGRIVVLAAHGIENPMILLRSNAARSCGPVLGGYLMDHPMKQSFALAKAPVFPYRGPQTTSHIEGFRDGAFREVYASFKCSIKNDGWASTIASWPRGSGRFPSTAQGDWLPGSIVNLVRDFGYAGTKLKETLAKHATHQITLNSACEQLPILENRVSLAPADKKDDLGLERPQIAYKVFDNDGGYVERCFHKIIQFHNKVFDHIGVTHRFMMDDQPTFKLFLGSGHIMGTTRMGTDRTKAVVDPECRAFDHPNLFVVGSSVFPTGANANPTSTVAALALRAADSIERQLRSGS